MVANARQKAAKKRLDLIVANNIAEGDTVFGSDSNKVFLIDKNGETEDLPRMSKREVAERILDKVVQLVEKRPV